MLRRFLPFALTAALLCPLAAFAQTPTDPTPPIAPAAPLPKHHPHVGGKISAVDAAAKTVTLTHGKKTILLLVPDGTKIYKIGDVKGQPTGTFADLTVNTLIHAQTTGDEESPVAKVIHLHAPKTTTPPAVP